MTLHIRELAATRVRMPLQAPTRWALGVHASVARTLIELRTEEGVTGIGETYDVPGADPLLAVATDALRGVDPLHVNVVQERLGALGGSYETMIPAGLRGGIETACLDAAGRALGVPVSALLGGAVRERVDVAAYLFYRQRSSDGRHGGEDSPQAIVARAEELVGRYGFGVLKLKGGVQAPEEELQALQGLHDRFPAAALRWDPNGAWSVGTALACAERLRGAGLALQYLEDPTPDLESMAEVRRRAAVALATNMCVVAPEHLAPAIRLGSVDVVLADPHYWGGFRENRRMMAVCRAFGLGVGMHSDNDLGVSNAARLHLAAAAPELGYAIDWHGAEHPSDLLTAPLMPRDGAFAVPDGPGLGVELDPELVERYRVD